jgi:hypothetical protein
LLDDRCIEVAVIVFFEPSRAQGVAVISFFDP